MRRHVFTLAIIAIALLSGCSSDDESSSTSSPDPTTEAAVESTSSTVDQSEDVVDQYVQTLLDVRGSIGSSWTAESAMEAAEQLNLATVPEGYALRHEEILDLLQSLGGTRAS